VTASGHPRSIFRRACERGNLVVAEATLRELGRPSLGELLELTILIAARDPRRHPRVAARWLVRYLETNDRATIDDAALAASCLAALGGARHEEAAMTLRVLTKVASGELPERGAA
jgi:hypothetical protein